jgi:hypothetical protein
MTHGTDSSTRLDDHDHEHDPRDPVYTDDARDEAYHAEDDTERDNDTDTELDAAARPDATDTVDDDRDDAPNDELTSSDETRADEMRAGENRYDVDTRTGDDQAADYDQAAGHDQAAAGYNEAAGHDQAAAGYNQAADYDQAGDHDVRDHDARDDEVTRGGDPFGVNEATRERDAFQADEADYESTHTHGDNRTDGEAIAVPAGPVEANPPTAVAVAPVNAVEQDDDAGAYEAGTDRDAVEAANADSSTGTVYEGGTAQEADDQRADNGPIAPDATSEAQSVHDDMKPGSVEPAPIAAFWNDGDAEGIRERWRELQLRFIDDPESVTGEAERLVEEAVASLTGALNRAKQELGDWRDGQGNDTERLRAAVRSYRDFLDRLLGL